MLKKQFVTLFFFITLAIHGIAQVGCIPEQQNPPRLVNDFANVLSPSFESQLENYLIGFNDTTSTQIALVTVDDLCGEEASFFAFDLGEKWGVGNSKFDNGIVILFKPKQKSSKGQAFIATGYGLEGVLPDATTKLIVENEMIPNFKNGQVERGLLQGIQRVIEITGGEYSATNYNSQGSGKGAKGSMIPFLFLILVAGIMFAGTFGRAKKYAKRNDTSIWLALMLMGSMNNRHKGHYGNFGSGRGGFGGFGGGSSGGSFGGFGGGGFGGGGAGGSW